MTSPAPPVPAPPAAPLQLWGGVEGSAVRVGDAWRDQVRETGHHDRSDDLDRVAALGIRTLRYPVLWERCAPGPACCGWDWHDKRMGRLQALGIAPVVGLSHHGSGPPGHSLLDPRWADGLAEHAGLVAARYPWVRHWTPVNEPLTTARFAALYGFWHPHAATEAAFEAAVLVQCRAVLLAMRAIRRRVPDAQLVQTEDLGRVFATPPLAYQAAHENKRRWLSLDLLCGRVDRAHPAWERLAALGFPSAWLHEFLDGDAGPDLLGVNHYVTSDRFLDHRTGLYPPALRGGNNQDTYVDTEAARMDLPAALTGWDARLREAWARFQRPMAITEVHLACQDEAEPVRWLAEAWAAAQRLRADGADIRAVCAWSLFGAVDWDTMLRERAGRYEAGAWDARTNPPRPTRLAAVLARLAQTGQLHDPALSQPGWWRRHDRLHHAAKRA